MVQYKITKKNICLNESEGIMHSGNEIKPREKLTENFGMTY